MAIAEPKVHVLDDDVVVVVVVIVRKVGDGERAGP